MVLIRPQGYPELPIFLPFGDAALESGKSESNWWSIAIGERLRHAFFDKSQSGGIKAGELFRPQLLDQTRQSGGVERWRTSQAAFLGVVAGEGGPLRCRLLLL